MSARSVRFSLVTLLLFVAFALSSTWAHEDIKATAILLRHGNRIATREYPGLQCSLFSEIGREQLTNEGSRQLYENGVLLRLKYLDLFPEDGYFRAHNMQIMSSKSDRCIMSLQSFMAGFFPPPLLDLNLPLYWQPFTHTLDKDGTMLLYNPDPSNCPRFSKDMESSSAANYVVNQWLVDDRAVFDELEVLLGASVRTRTDVGILEDTIRTMFFLDCDVPQWATDVYWSTLRKYALGRFQALHETDLMKKVRGGPMLTEIVRNMQAVANDEESGKNFLIYSAHDHTVASLAHVLNVVDQLPEMISYADGFMVDLVENGGGEPSVKVIYLSRENVLPNHIPMNVPGCGFSCPLSTFVAATSQWMVESRSELCAL